jgi:hypothetical protein
MSKPTKPSPRFVPTLTEVVDPPRLNAGPVLPEPTAEELIDQVQRQVLPNLERRVEQALYRLVGELISQKWSTISSELTKDVNELIDQKVREALAQQKPGSV